MKQFVVAVLVSAASASVTTTGFGQVLLGAGLTYSQNFDSLSNTPAGSSGSIRVSYTGEHWRNGGNTAAQTLAFSWATSSSPLTNPIGTDSVPKNGWPSVSELNFVTPTTGATAVAPGQEIFLPWVDIEDSGSAQGFGVDDLTVTFPSMHEPSALALVGLGLLGLAGWRRFGS